MTGDAECFVWETLWSLHKESDHLEYDLLVSPHHCSWHSLSYDSQSDDEPQVCEDAKSALSQSKSGARIIAQCKPIKNNDNDPPSKAAKDEYVEIVTEDNFYCTDEYPPKDKIPKPLEFNLTSNGPQKKGIKEISKLSVAALASTKESYPHG